MGHINQLLFLKSQLKTKPQTTLEIGSKDYGNTIDFRSLIGGDYTGVDMDPGKNVDVVQDLTQGIGSLKTYDLVICCSVLEHTPTPWKLAKTIASLVKPGALLYISVPWIQRYHAYPDDYYRFTWRGLESLFPNFTFSEFLYSTFTAGEFLHCKPEADNSLQLKAHGRKYLPCLEIHGLGRYEPR